MSVTTPSSVSSPHRLAGGSAHAAAGTNRNAENSSAERILVDIECFLTKSARSLARASLRGRANLGISLGYEKIKRSRLDTGCAEHRLHCHGSNQKGRGL